MPQMTHVRLEIGIELHRQLKHRAIDEGKTYSALLRELIEAGVAKQNEKAAAKV